MKPIRTVLLVLTALSLLAATVSGCKKKAAEGGDAEGPLNPSEAVIGIWDGDMEAITDLLVENFSQNDPTLEAQIRAGMEGATMSLDVRDDGTYTMTVIGVPGIPPDEQVKTGTWEPAESTENSITIVTSREGENKRRHVVFQSHDRMTTQDIGEEGEPPMPMIRRR